MACMYILFSFLFYKIVEMKFNLNILQLLFFSENMLYSNGLYGNTCADPDSFARAGGGGPTLTTFFLS